MNILELLKQRHNKQLKEKSDLTDKKQLNTEVSVQIIQKIRRLSAEFAVPQYAITQHLLETGYFYMSKVLLYHKKKEYLRKHLIDKHMLDCGYDDPEELLRIGEGGYASALIAMAKAVIANYRDFERAFGEAERTLNFDSAEKTRKKLLTSAVNFASWLSTHPLEEPDEDDV